MVTWLLGLAFMFSACSPAQTDTGPATVDRLTGTWKSDWALTKAHLDANAIISADQMHLLSQLMGKMTVTYDSDSARFSTPAYDFVTMEGNSIPIEASVLELPLSIIGQTEHQIAIETTAPIEGDSIVLIQFVDNDTYWIYVAHSPLIDLHVREYFTRLPTAEGPPAKR